MVMLLLLLSSSSSFVAGGAARTIPPRRRRRRHFESAATRFFVSNSRCVFFLSRAPFRVLLETLNTLPLQKMCFFFLPFSLESSLHSFVPQHISTTLTTPLLLLSLTRNEACRKNRSNRAGTFAFLRKRSSSSRIYIFFSLSLDATRVVLLRRRLIPERRLFI